MRNSARKLKFLGKKIEMLEIKSSVNQIKNTAERIISRLDQAEGKKKKKTGIETKIKDILHSAIKKNK
jgi:hypothetical protein